MAIALVAADKVQTDGTGGTTTAINSTGATVLVASISLYGPSRGLFSNISDSKSNTWTQRSTTTSGGTEAWIFVAENPTVGSGHTLTVALTSGQMYYTAVLAAFSGTTTTSTYDKQNSATTSTNTSVQPGSSGTPTVAGSLVVAAYSMPDGSTGVSSTPSGFSLAAQGAYVGGTAEGGGMWWKESSSAENPTFTGWSGGTGDISAAIVVLKGDGSGGGGGTTRPFGMLLGVS